MGRGKSLQTNKRLLADTVAALKPCRYFKTMSADVLGDLLREGAVIEAPARTVLIREGALDDEFYILLEGALQVLSNGKLILRLNTPGDIIGEMAIISSSPRSADVVAEVASRLVRISSAVMKAEPVQRDRTQQLLTVFSHIMAAKLTETSQRAKLYEDSVLEVREIASSNTRLESQIQDKLQEIALYSRVIETSNDAVLVADLAGNIQQSNPASHQMFKALARKAAQGKGSTMKELLRSFDLGEYPDIAPGQPWRGEWSRGPEDNQYVLQVTVTPIQGRDGQAIAGIAYQLHDITLQKAQERAIVRKNEEIQKALSDLEQTYQELQRSDRLKMESLTVISNELSAPVRRIVNHVHKLAELLGAEPPEAAHTHLRAISDQSQFLKAISDNITYLLDLQAEFQAREPEPMDLAAVVREVVGEIEGKAARKGNPFAVELPAEPLTLLGTPDQVKIVLNLILEQAAQVCRADTPLSITGVVDGEGDQVRLTIAYTGPSLAGIRPNDVGQGRLGLLIGLPLARKVISQHQGSLQFAEDKSTATVEIVLPRGPKEGQERPNRIIVADEQTMDRLIVRGVIEHLWPGSVILEATDPFELLDSYEDFRPDLVILDPQLTEPGWSNHRLLGSLVQQRRHVCPVLAISGLYEDFAERSIAVERGVSDFLAKPYSIFDLRFKIRSLLQSHRKEESLHKNMDQAQRQASTDALTKLGNRKHLDSFLETQINYSRQTRKPCSVILLDIDNFKHYNDTNGHQLGDEVLKGVGQILIRSVRASDLAARYGGEEFMLVLPETRKDMAVVIAEKVRRTIQEKDFPYGKTQPLGFVSSSFGVATFPEDGDSPADLIHVADECLYTAKQWGRNRVVRAEERLRSIAG
ncbi:MAG: diguanylate cyclase [Candidatus Lambdaproteobacteria bacterium]|nr:diguanylate cyclase [Candidatus Lambdaproteobacteria bacterium]